MLALWMEWIFLRPCLRAYSNANLAMRVEPFSVITLMLSTTPGTTSCSRPDVFALRVFAHDDQVDAGPLRFQAGKILDGPEVGEEVEFLAQRDVDALEAASDRRGDRPFERHFVALNGFVERRGNVLAEDLEGFGAGGVALPIEVDAGGFKDADDGLRDFGADAVAGDQRDLVGLHF